MSQSALLRPQDLLQIASDAEMKKMDETLEFEKKKRQQREELRKAFAEREVHPEAIDRINAAVRMAAGQGHHQLQVVTFPSTFCTDGGGASTMPILSGRARSRASPRRPTTISKRSCAHWDTRSRRRSSLGLTVFPVMSR